MRSLRSPPGYRVTSTTCRRLAAAWSPRTLGLALLLAALAALAASPALPTELPPEDVEFFETRIRPVLVERCYACHGGDPKKIYGGLVLLHADGVLAGGDSGAVVVPGSPEESLLIQAIRYDGLTQMPPDGRLDATIVADFEEWIRRGAPDPRLEDGGVVAQRSESGPYDFGPGREHWAYARIGRHEPPEVQDTSWISGPVDRFILAQLEGAGTTPIERASKNALLRRVTFDLIGLAPTEEELEAFLGDDSPQAFERVVDRLLASSHFGERWGRHWLDVARYADSNGLDENIGFRNAFRYRDYVISAFNDDKPFDEFLHEQIAGDLLPYESEIERFENLTATGFLTLGPKVLAERDLQKKLIDIVDEQVNVLGRAFLATPIGCARCHDHKFDPIPTSDYYALAGIFRSTQTLASPDGNGMATIQTPIAPPDQLEAYEAARASVSEAREKVAGVVRAHNAELRAPRREALVRYLLAMEEAYPHFVTEEAGDEAHAEARRFIAEVAKRHRLESPVLERFVGRFYRMREGPPVEGDAPNPKTVFEVWDAFAGADPADYGAVTERLRAQIASEKLLVSPLTKSLVRGPPPGSLEELAHRYGALFYTVQLAWEQHLARVAVKPEEERTAADGSLSRDFEELRWLLYGDGYGAYFCFVCLDQEAEEELYPQDVRDQLVRLRAEVEALEEKSPPEPPHAMTVADGEIVDLPVHIRGSHLNLADEPTPRGFLRVTDHLVPPPPLGDEQSGRLELARWMTHPEQPLTSRVIVNRLWRWLFGRGLSATPSNFGTTGSAPTHPELLDYLARRFIDEGWRIKPLLRELLLSSTYQLAARFDEQRAAVDEDNLLLWRSNRRRLEAEPIRDALLQLAGRLDLTMGGRVEQYAPRGYVFAEGSTFGQHDFYSEPRRSIYLPVVRNAIYKVLAGFDFGDASDSVGNRPSTIVPPQALLMMNSPFVIEAAQGFAEQLLATSKDPRVRVEKAFLRAYSRPPESAEVEDALAFLEVASRESEEAAEESPELLAWTRLCQVLLASSEFLYVG